MTIQVAVMNGFGVAMASDRHVYRGADARSTGQDTKLMLLRGTVPAAMMASGPFAVFGLPVSRLAIRLERALLASAGEGPEALASAVLGTLEQPLDGPTDADADIVAETADAVIQRALARGRDPRSGLERLLAELELAPRCRDSEAIEASGQAAWQAALPSLMAKPAVADALRHAPELYGRAVVGALARDWRKEGELYLTVGLCCPTFGVPAVVALRLWKGIGNRLHFASRFDRDYEAAWKAGRTAVVTQGSGRATVEGMVDGLADEHWSRLSTTDRDGIRGGMNGRWEAVHTRLGVSTPRELAAVATGLVRGAEVLGYLTRESEGTVAEIDCAILTPRGATYSTLSAGPDLRDAA
jgi:hypothetical protein